MAFWPLAEEKTCCYMLDMRSSEAIGAQYARLPFFVFSAILTLELLLMKMNYLKFSWATCVAGCLLCLPVTAATFTFTGLVDNNFNNVNNWNDGLGGTPATMAGTLNDDFIVNGFTVSAGSGFGIGNGGSLSLTGSTLNFSPSSNLTFFTGSEALFTNSTVNLNNNASQMSFNSGSTTSLNGAVLNVGDDVFFRGAVSIIDSSVTSRVDDVEFQATASVSTISGSQFKTLDAAQIISLQVPTTVSTSTFTSGRLSLETGADMTATDSTFALSGDIDDAFNDISFAVLTLNGSTTLEADQLDEGITLVLDGSATATFSDDDQEGEWFTTSSAGTGSRPATVVFLSRTSSLTFIGPQNPTNDATQIFNGLSGSNFAYSTNPELFTPNDWDGQSDITIRAVPEPTSVLLAIVLLAGVGLRRV